MSKTVLLIAFYNCGQDVPPPLFGGGFHIRNQWEIVLPLITALLRSAPALVE